MNNSALPEFKIESSALRDALLPKLCSGEIRLPAALRNHAAQAGVKDAERFLKEQGLG